MKFYECRRCGNIVSYHREMHPWVKCCDAAMLEIEPNTADGSSEKHVPQVTVHDREVIVRVGEQPHPMVSDHYIQWVLLETTWGCHKHYLEPGLEPETRFTLQPEEAVRSAYEYCNIHGLWKSPRRD